MILYAPNVNVGGGAVLLVYLISAIKSDKDLYFLDQRIQNDVSELVDGKSVIWVKPSFYGRLVAELKLAKFAKKHSKLLCFHGVPPVFAKHGAISVYLQNRLLFVSPSKLGFSIRTRVRLLFEKALLHFNYKSVSTFFVQTETMKNVVNAWLATKVPGRSSPNVLLAPFWDTASSQKPSNAGVKSRYDFCYVADGQPHKNHRALFEALRLLAKEGVFPSVAVTLEKRACAHNQEIAKLRSDEDVRITNLGRLTHGEVFELYDSSKAMIFPSLLESFGLPLLEASLRGLPILAGELDYVRDVCNPAETFDPTEPRSIARAIKRYLKIPPPDATIGSAEEFLKIMNGWSE